jgi:hypothetical protein
VNTIKKHDFLEAIDRSGGAKQPDNEVDAVLVKLAYLEKLGRYDRLIRTILNANNKCNFIAAIFEATFAYQFELAGIALEYEVNHAGSDNSSIDFSFKTHSRKSVFLELHLLQQEASTTKLINDQLELFGCYKARKDGADENKTILRLQGVILNKVQKSDGKPTKFFDVNDEVVNIVVIDLTDLIFGMVDINDCLLVAHGDSAVGEKYQRGVFGLFQKANSSHSEQIQRIAKSFEHIRNKLSGVLFCFRSSKVSALNYDLKQYIVWNPNLLGKALAKDVLVEITRALPMRKWLGNKL